MSDDGAIVHLPRIPYDFEADPPSWDTDDDIDDEDETDWEDDDD